MSLKKVNKSELGYSFILTNQNSVYCMKFNFESNKARIEDLIIR